MEKSLVQTVFLNALRQIFRPIVRVMIARGVLFPAFAALAKEVFVDVAAQDFRLDGKRVTDSRLSLLTGLQRRDIRTLRAKLEATEVDVENRGSGPLPRVLARWQGALPYRDSAGQPLVLPRTTDGGAPCFEALVAEVSRDVHPRTILDELVRLELVSFDADSDSVTLTAKAFLPRHDETALLRYFANNLSDHASSAAENLLAAPSPGPFFERAVHYNGLSADSVAALDKLARDLQMDALSRLNAEALALQDADTGRADAAGRFRCGAFVYFSQHPGHSEEKDEDA